MKKPTRKEFIALARELYAEGSDNNIEVDDDAKLSLTNSDGRSGWVQAWVWIEDGDFTLAPDGEDEEAGS